MPGRSRLIAQFVHSAVNRFRRPGDTRGRQRDAWLAHTLNNCATSSISPYSKVNNPNNAMDFIRPELRVSLGNRFSA